MKVNCDVWLNEEPIRIEAGYAPGVLSIHQAGAGYPQVTLWFGHARDAHSDTIARMTALRDELTRQIEEMEKSVPPPLPITEIPAEQPALVAAYPDDIPF